MTTFDTEIDARLSLENLLGQQFMLVPEVRLTHLDGSNLRIDYIAVPRAETAFPAAFFGVEVKKGYPSFRDFTAALKQCIDYRHSSITDLRSKKYQGVVPPFVFLYPSLEPAIDGPYKSWVGGATRLAGRFNVGVIRNFIPYYMTHQEVLRFEVSETRYWSNNYGSHATGAVFGSARRRGSA